jgi:2,3-bisphosphoglycerate-dependent phosphoglycerate mutase
LTNDGVLEARVAGQMLKRSGIRFDEVHTSLLRRSIRTANLVLMEMNQEYIPVHKHWRLNERSYGDLVGQNKKEAVKKFGKDQVKQWRRSYDIPPPPMSPHHPYHPARDPRYGPVSIIVLHCTGSSLMVLVTGWWCGSLTQCLFVLLLSFRCWEKSP